MTPNPPQRARNAPDSSQATLRTRHILTNTLLVGACFALAAFAGILRNIVIARQFGIGADLDAYYAAFKLPDLLFTIVAGGALATAFIPVFAETLQVGRRSFRSSPRHCRWATGRRPGGWPVQSLTLWF
jgi:putative peptidoglycan lipid II flippase